jgi:hypothetical protein
MLSTAPLSTVSPRFSAIQATVKHVSEKALEYTIIFESPKDIGDTAAFLRTNEILSEEGPGDPLKHDMLEVKLIVGNGDKRYESFVSLSYSKFTDNKHYLFSRKPDMQESVKRLARRLPLPQPYRDYLEMATHNAIAEQPEQRIELPAATRLVQEMKLAPLQKQQNEDAFRLAALESQVATLKSAMDTRAAKIQELLASLYSGQ